MAKCHLLKSGGAVRGRGGYASRQSVNLTGALRELTVASIPATISHSAPARAVSDHSDLGARVEVDHVQGHSPDWRAGAGLPLSLHNPWPSASSWVRPATGWQHLLQSTTTVPV